MTEIIKADDLLEAHLSKPRRYLFVASLPYSMPILRPLQRAIVERGDEVAWFFDTLNMNKFAKKGDRVLTTAGAVMRYNPLVVFTSNNNMYEFFPGIKVQLFHGYSINKRNKPTDGHFRIRGFFDIYCTQGPISTNGFKAIEGKHNHFTVYETGWPKGDLYFNALKRHTPKTDREPNAATILYSSTFTTKFTSTSIIADKIEEMLQKHKEWSWIFMFHPKLDSVETIERYNAMVEKYPNASWASSSFDLNAMINSDIMLSDSSSIIIEYMLLSKPVVTFRNSRGGEHLIDVQETYQILPAIEYALQQPKEQIEKIKNYVVNHEAHLDGGSSKRVLAAVDHFIENKRIDTLDHKPINIIRRFKMWVKLKKLRREQMRK